MCGGLFVAVGDSGTIATSPDGRTWTLRNSGVSNKLHCVCYGNGAFVAGGDRIRNGFDFNNKIVSSDGIHWNLVPAEQYAADVWSIAFGSGMFVAVSNYEGSGAGETYSSVDGINWSHRGTLYRAGDAQALICVTFGNGRFVTASRDVLTSTITSGSGNFLWNQVYTAPRWLSALSYGDGRFVGVTWSALSAFSHIISSSDGINWTSQEMPDIYALAAIAFGDHQFLTVGIRGKVLTSPDGESWIQHSTGMESAGFTGVCHGRGTFVVVGAQGIILQSEFSGAPLLDINRSGSSVELAITGEIGSRYRLQASSNMEDWADVLTFVSQTNATRYVETNLPLLSQKYYRAVVD